MEHSGGNTGMVVGSLVVAFLLLGFVALDRAVEKALRWWLIRYVDEENRDGLEVLVASRLRPLQFVVHINKLSVKLDKLLHLEEPLSGRLSIQSFRLDTRFTWACDWNLFRGLRVILLQAELHGAEVSIETKCFPEGGEQSFWRKRRLEFQECERMLLHCRSSHRYWRILGPCLAVCLPRLDLHANIIFVAESNSLVYRNDVGADNEPCCSMDTQAICHIKCIRVTNARGLRSSPQGCASRPQVVEFRVLQLSIEVANESKLRLLRMVRHVDIKGELEISPFERNSPTSAGVGLNFVLDTSPLVVHLDKPVMSGALKAICDYVRSTRLWQIRHFRPTLSVQEEPEAWWRYAVQAVLQRYKNDGKYILPSGPQSYWERVAMAADYRSLYKNVLIRSLCPVSLLSSKALINELHLLEQKLPFDCVHVARYRAIHELLGTFAGYSILLLFADIHPSFHSGAPIHCITSKQKTVVQAKPSWYWYLRSVDCKISRLAFLVQVSRRVDFISEQELTIVFSHLSLRMHKKNSHTNYSSVMFDDVSMKSSDGCGEGQTILEISQSGEKLDSSLLVVQTLCTECCSSDGLSRVCMDVQGFPAALTLSNTLLAASQDIVNVTRDVFVAFSLPPMEQRNSRRTLFQVDYTCDGEIRFMLPCRESDPAWLVFRCHQPKASFRKIGGIGLVHSATVWGQGGEFMPAFVGFPPICGWSVHSPLSTILLCTTVGVSFLRERGEETKSTTFLENVRINARTLAQNSRPGLKTEKLCFHGLKFSPCGEQGVWNFDLGSCSSNVHIRIQHVLLKIRPDLLTALHDCASNLFFLLTDSAQVKMPAKHLSKKQMTTSALASFSISVEASSFSVSFADENSQDFCMLRIVNIRAQNQVQGSQIQSTAEAAGVFVEGVPGAPSCLLRPNEESCGVARDLSFVGRKTKRRRPPSPSGNRGQFLRMSVTADTGLVSTKVQLAGIWLLADPKFLKILFDGCFLYLDLCRELISNLLESVTTRRADDMHFGFKENNNVSATLLFELSSLEILLLESSLVSPPRSPGAGSFTLCSGKLSWQLNKDWYEFENSILVDELVLCSGKERVLLSIRRSPQSTREDGSYAGKIQFTVRSCGSSDNGPQCNPVLRQECRMQVKVGKIHFSYDYLGLQQVLEIFVFFRESVGAQMYSRGQPWLDREAHASREQTWRTSVQVDLISVKIPKSWGDVANAIVISMESVDGNHETCNPQLHILVGQITATYRTALSDDTMLLDAPALEVHVNMADKQIRVVSNVVHFYFHNDCVRIFMWLMHSNCSSHIPDSTDKGSEGLFDGESNSPPTSEPCSDAVPVAGQSVACSSWSMYVSISQTNAKVVGLQEGDNSTGVSDKSFVLKAETFTLSIQRDDEELMCTICFERLKLWQNQGTDKNSTPKLLLECPGTEHGKQDMYNQQCATGRAEPSKFSFSWLASGVQVVHFVLSHSCTFYMKAEDLVSLNQLWELLKVFTSYEVPEHVSHHVEGGADSWIHLNVVLERCSVLLQQEQDACVGSTSSLILHGQQLYVNYSWDRGSNAVTKVIFNGLEGLVQRGGDPGILLWDPGMLSCLLPFTVLFERTWSTCFAKCEHQIIDDIKVDAAEGVIWPEALLLLQPLMGALLKKWSSGDVHDGVDAEQGLSIREFENNLECEEGSTVLPTQYSFSASLHAGVARLVDSAPAGRPILEISVDDLHGEYQTGGTKGDLIAKLDLKAGGRMFDDLGDTQPLMDPWHILLQKKCSLKAAQYLINSDQRLNLLLSPRLLHILSSLECFVQSWNGCQPSRTDPFSTSQREVGRVQDFATQSRLASKAQRPWILMNETGVRLWFWNDDLGEKSRTYAVSPGEAQQMPWTHKRQSTARPPVLSVQLDGAWAPIRGLRFSATGQHIAVPARSLTGLKPVPLIADMPGGRRLRLRSPLRIRNCTNLVLSLRLQNADGGPNIEDGSSAQCRSFGFLHPGKFASVPLTALSVNTVAFINAHLADGCGTCSWMANDGLWLGSLKGKLDDLKGLMVCTSDDSSSCDALYLTLNAVESHRVPWMADEGPLSGEGIDEDYVGLCELQVLPPLVVESRLPEGYMLSCSFISDQLASSHLHPDLSSEKATYTGEEEAAKASFQSSKKLPNVFPRTFKRISSKTVVEKEVETVSLTTGQTVAKGVVSGHHIYRFDVKRHTVRLSMTLTVPQHFDDTTEESTLGFQMAKPVRVIAPKTRRSLQRAVPKRRKVELALNRGTAALETTRKWAVLAVDMEQVVHGALSYRVAVSAPYLLANHTPIPVSFRTYKVAVKGQSSIVTVPPCEESEERGWRAPAPALFYSKDKRVLLKVGTSNWSFPFEIDKVGLDCVLRLQIRDQPSRAYDVGLGISWIKSSDGRRISRLITISPAVVLKNCTGKPMKVVGTRTGEILVDDCKVLPLLSSVQAEDTAEVSLPKEEMEGDMVVGHRFLCIKPDDVLSGNLHWTWSEPFRINTPGDQTLRLCALHPESSASNLPEACRDGNTAEASESTLLDVHVQFVSASLIVTLGPLGSPRVAPYRISNACSKMRLKCYQKGLSSRYFYVEPLSSVEYAWDAPVRPRRLKVALQPFGCSQVFVREYELDEIATRPSIIVKYKQQPQHKDKNTVESSPSSRHFSRVASMTQSKTEKQKSVLSRGKQKVTRGFSEPRGILTSSKPTKTSDGDQQQQHSRRLKTGSREITEVFSVRVFASGSTRVLEFSDLAGTLSEDRNEEARLIASKFEKVQKRISSVDQALHQLNIRNEQIPSNCKGDSVEATQSTELLTPGNALLISAADRFSRTVSFPKSTPEIATNAAINDSSVWDIASIVAGGELRVLVCAVDGFREGSPITQTDKSLTYVTNLSRLRPFVRVCCGKQQRQTWAHKSGQNRPSGWTWDEELVFHGVAATDTIRVEVLDYNRKGEHGFLGEAFVDLAPFFQDEDIEDTVAAETNAGVESPGRRASWFTLTSRGASRNALYHGRVGLALSWNRSLLEQLTLALKAKESELHLKESILSELQGAHEGATDTALAASLSQASGRVIQGDKGGNLAGLFTRWTRQRQAVNEDKDLLRKDVAKPGSSLHHSKEKYEKLLIRVIEARGLNPSETSLAPSRSHCDSYVRVNLKGVGFHSPAHTRTIYSTNDPVWNESISFAKLYKNSSIKFEVFRRNKFGKDTKLGTATVDVSKLPPKVPHYLRLQLSSKRRRSRHTDQASSAWLGELRVRIQCMRAPGASFDNSMGQLSHVNDVQDEEDANFRLHVRVPGIGLSLAEGAAHPGLSWSSGNELLHLYVGECDLQLARVSGDDRVRLTVKTLQLDNQLFSAQDPVILYPTPVTHQESSRPVLEVSFVKSHSDVSAVHFRYLSFLMQELDIHLEEAWLDQVSSFVLETILVWKSHSLLGDEDVEGDATGAALSISRSLQTASIQLALEHARASPPQLMQGRRLWYVELLHIHPIKVNVTVRTGHTLGPPPLEDVGIVQEKADAGFSALTGFPILSISNAPVRLDALLVEHVFEQRSELVDKLHTHYRRQILVEIYKVIGSAAALGSPVAALADVGTGVTSLFYEPARGFVQR
eukprot:scaffold153_cov347-Pavlova_lutheri.AAC.38